jgi:hypothetical protein
MIVIQIFNNEALLLVHSQENLLHRRITIFSNQHLNVRSGIIINITDQVSRMPV